MFYNDLKFKVNFLEVNNPGKKSTPFSRLPKKSLDRKPLKISTVFGKPFDFIELNLKQLVPVQPFAGSKPCILQGIISGQVTGNAGNIQNICSKVWCFDTIQKYHHFAPYQKPFKKYHIKTIYQSIAAYAPTNRIYPTCYLLFFVGVLRYPFDPCSWMAHDNQPLTIEHIKDILSSDHIQMTSKNDKKETNLIYAPTFDKQFHSLSMTNHSLSIVFNHFSMNRNDKFYLHILSICTYIILSICI